MDGDGVSPLVAVAMPASCLVAPVPTGGDGLPRHLRSCQAVERGCRGRAAVSGHRDRVPCPCTPVHPALPRSIPGRLEPASHGADISVRTSRSLGAKPP